MLPSPLDARKYHTFQLLWGVFEHLPYRDWSRTNVNSVDMNLTYLANVVPSNSAELRDDRRSIENHKNGTRIMVAKRICSQSRTTAARIGANRRNGKKSEVPVITEQNNNCLVLRSSLCLSLDISIDSFSVLYGSYYRTNCKVEKKKKLSLGKRNRFLSGFDFYQSAKNKSSLIVLINTQISVSAWVRRDEWLSEVKIYITLV